MPSPLPDQPGLLLRDPFRYTDDVLVIPPPWIALLECLDGAHGMRDAQVRMMRLSGGELVTRDAVRQFLTALGDTGYLENEELQVRKKGRHEAFAAAPLREAILAGSAYPAERREIEAELSKRCDGGSAAAEPEAWPLAIAAPHVSPEGGFDSYCAAYELPPAGEEMTFVILGTSHYGAPERFGVTEKPFETPLGTVAVDREALSAFVERAGDAVVAEDYCHRTEHSIEFQVLFLQHRLARPFRIVPILCGPFLESLTSANAPEHLDSNARVFDALAELASSRPELVWVLGVDMAHVGLRYGANEPARAGEEKMLDVREQDARRLERITEGDAEGFFELVHPGGDELNWCGYAPIYTFLRSAGAAFDVKGGVRSYEQWNIDPGSVVTFSALHFHRSD